MTSEDQNSWFMRLLDEQEDNQLKDQILSLHRSVVRGCRDKFALQDARDIVPIAELVQENLNILEGDYQDNLLPILTQWYANEFFGWFTPPSCEKCDGQLINHETGVNPEGLQVETYKCTNSAPCNYTFDFIRHNDPAILLRTRKGRCGEWANCFLLILRAMDYDARIVLDTTDHVWNEVWSESKQRWIHVDPCEAVVDCPLIYELGWSKKLEYCIAFSEYEIIDVTCRYTKDMNAIRQTRSEKSCQSGLQRELWLARFLDKLTMQAVRDVDQTTRETILARRELESKYLEDLETNGRPDVDVSKLGGRKTGSIAWRIARGEYSPIVRNLNVIKVRYPGAGDLGGGIFSMQYDCDKNVYTSSLGDLNVRGWQNLIYQAENIDHKFERDWKTSYLARYESCAAGIEGNIQWRFDLSAIDSWTRIEIIIEAEQWPDTRVAAKIVPIDNSDSATRELKLNEVNILTPDELGTTKLTHVHLIISLSGGQPEDSVAWQKPQLFRQVRGQSSEFPFSFKIFKT